MSQPVVHRRTAGLSETVDASGGERLDLLLEEGWRLGVKQFRLVVPMDRICAAPAAYRYLLQRLPADADVVLTGARGQPSISDQLLDCLADEHSVRPGLIERPLPSVPSTAELRDLRTWLDTAADIGWTPLLTARAAHLPALLEHLSGADMLGRIHALACDASRPMPAHALAAAGEWLDRMHPEVPLWLTDADSPSEPKRGTGALGSLAETCTSRIRRVYWSPPTVAPHSNPEQKNGREREDPALATRI